MLWHGLKALLLSQTTLPAIREASCGFSAAPIVTRSAERRGSTLIEAGRPAGVHEAAGDSSEAPPAPLRPHPGPEGRPHCGRRQLPAAAGMLHKPSHSTCHTLSACGTIAARQVTSDLAVFSCTMPVHVSQTICIKEDSAATRTWDLRRSWAAGRRLS